MTMQPVDLSRAHRLINHGPTVLISARHEGVDNVMPAAWASVLDMAPTKVLVVLDGGTRTRELAEASGQFIMQVPVVGQLAIVDALGTISRHDDPDKLMHAGVTLFQMPEVDMPFVAGCAGWMVCRIIEEPHNQQTYDLFIAEVQAAWAEDTMFRNGRWIMEDPASPSRTLHHVSGGRYFASGETMDVNRSPDEGPGN